MLNPIRNIEKSIGSGGPDAAIDAEPRGFSPLRRRPHNYPMRRKTALRFQDGGEVEQPQQPQPDPADLKGDDLSPHDQQLQDIVVEAMLALRGENPDPQKAIRRFIDTFGEDEFQDFRQMVMSQGHMNPDDEEDPDEPEPDDDEDDVQAAPSQAAQGPPQAPQGMQVGGLLRGPGTGQSDEIEAATPSGRKVLLSDGEYVIDAPTVAALGDGSTSAGARRLDAFRKAVREESYGHDKQPKAMRKGGRALLAALSQ